MTRISTSTNFDSGIDLLIQRQADMDASQAQMITGKRVNKPSDDPAAAARIERALAGIARVDATQRGVDASKSAMTQSESALGDAGDLLQQARQALVAAGNGSYTDAERKSQADELTNIRSQLLQIANRSDGNGGYLFAGQGSSQPPFLDQPGGVKFIGTPGQSHIPGTDGLPTSVDGGASWMAAGTGNGVFETSVVTSTSGAWIDTGSVVNPSLLTGATYDVRFAVNAGVTSYSVFKNGVATAQANVTYQPGTAIQIDGMAVTVTGTAAAGDDFQIKPSTPTLTVFDMLDKAISDLSTGQRSSTKITQTNAQNLRNIDQVMSRLQSARSSAGDTLNHIDSVTDRLGAQKLQGQNDQSAAQDLDMVQALSDFQNKQTGYDAALKSYASIQRMSLYQYINTTN